MEVRFLALEPGFTKGIFTLFLWLFFALKSLLFSLLFLGEKGGVKEVVFDPFLLPIFIGIAPFFSLARGAFSDPEQERIPSQES